MTTPTPRVSAAADIHAHAVMAAASRGNAARAVVVPRDGSGGHPTDSHGSGGSPVEMARAGDGTSYPSPAAGQGDAGGRMSRAGDRYVLTKRGLIAVLCAEAEPFDWSVRP